jgi:hypothetical protein
VKEKQPGTALKKMALYDRVRQILESARSSAGNLWLVRRFYLEYPDMGLRGFFTRCVKIQSCPQKRLRTAWPM